MNNEKKSINSAEYKSAGTEFEETEKMLTKEDIAQFENTLKAKLPDDFKNHYLKYNGGYPTFEYVKGAKHIFTINGFMPIKYGTLSIEQTIEDYKKSGLIFNDKIPFAYDNGGNIFFISTNQNNYGAIFIGESEFLEDENRFYFVNNSFSEFLDSFYNEKE
jgi:cell wall assembly regulator SMI1